jgi:starch synthase
MTGRNRKKGMTIVFASSEIFPFSKTGGLADVAGALAPALAAAGHEVHLFTPLYRSIDRKKWNIGLRGKKVKVPISARVVEGSLIDYSFGGITIHFVRQDDYFDREGFYTLNGVDHPDNLERFSFFSRGVIEGVRKLGIIPDLYHLNDWQTALIAGLLKGGYATDSAVVAPTLLTIHNLAYQGLFPTRDWHLTGLPWGFYSPRIGEYYGQISLLKSGIATADQITTVSPTYAAEILTPTFGYGLEGILGDRGKALTGVLNGIDPVEWNPAIDPALPANYSVGDMSGKKICRSALLAQSGLTDGGGPVIGAIARLVEQKGLHLAASVIEPFLDRGARLVLLGSGSAEMEKMFTDLAAARPGEVSVTIGYNDALAHQIEGGADLYLMPSLYEPCGLNQMYSLAYGTPPLARATGGLNDTVVPFDPITGQGNGFKFVEPTATALATELDRGVTLYQTDPTGWHRMVENGMNEDHSWKNSADHYIQLYQDAFAGDHKP